MAVVCIDTNVLIWAIQGKAHKSQADMVLRTRALMAHLHKNKTQIVVPAIVFTEFLIGLPEDDQSQSQKIIEDNYEIIPYDTFIALFFNRIWRDINKGKNLPEVTRTELKADLMLVATALAVKSECIYSTDKPLKKIASSFIKIEDMQDISLQTLLPDID